MALRDLEVFIRQRAAVFDANLDTNPGSPFDTAVIQPLLRRIGPDPFSVDMTTFLDARLRQAFPDMAIGDGDALTDLLVKPATVLWDPIVREVARLKRGQSFKDPNSLTTEDADALGANLFANRAQGSFAKGTARILFAQAQNVSVSPVNFLTSRSGLHFFPTETQSIRVEEMLQNTDENGLFYFDITVIAEKPGVDYNLGPDELVSIANVDAAVQVQNQRKFGDGDEAATAAEFVDRTSQELTERSLVTIRGVAAKLPRAFPEITRLNVVGFNDPEMQRDVLKGGGLGSPTISGIAGATVSDLVGGALTRRFRETGAGFVAAVGPTGVPPTGFMLEVFGAFGTADVVRDLVITRVVSDDEVEVENAELVLGLTNLRWAVRRRELTLSGIPGGILFPDGATGTVTVPDDEVHIGGAMDVHVRGQSFDDASLVIDALADDAPETSGFSAEFDPSEDTLVTLGDLLVGSTYELGDETYDLLERAGRDALTLQIVDGDNAALYRILSVDQTGGNPVVEVTPAVGNPAATDARWRLFDAIDVALYDIKETRISGDDLITSANVDTVSTAGAVDFDALGVSEGDVLRVLEGPDAGDYNLTEGPLAPGFTSLRVDATFTSSQSGLSYLVFRKNAEGSVLLPLVRVRSLEVLDSSGQPEGTTVPYARPVDVQSRAFQNSARGVKHDVTDGLLGIVSQAATTFAVGGQVLALTTPLGAVNVAFTAGPNLSLATVISELNAAILAQVNEPLAALQVGANRFGIRPFGDGGVVTATGSSAALVALFGNNDVRSTRDVRSATIDEWASASPAIDLETGLDVVQVMDGHQVGPVAGPYELGTPRALHTADGERVFSPEAGVRLQVGARSIGSARVYFLEPTSFEARYGETFFELPTAGGSVRFTPDPTLSSQRIPALPDGDKPTDGATADGDATLTSASQDFLLSGIRAGDTVIIDYHPISGSQALNDPHPNVVGTTLVFSVDGSPDKTLTFIRDDVTLDDDEVTRQGIADQINAAAGVDIAQITGGNTLEFEADASIVIRGSGTANAVILDALDGTGDTFVGFDQRNTAPHAGTYQVTAVAQDELELDELLTNGTSFSTPFTRQQYKVYRDGVQRIATGQMKDNTAEASLFYFDVELVSEGTGDQFNIDADLQLTASGYRSDGYYLTTEDENLTFSPLERPRLVISKTILPEGVDDDPANAVQLTGTNLLLSYDRSSLVEDAQNFMLSETERVVNSSPLARHLIPNFVRLDMTYTGGSKEDVVIPDVEKYMVGLAPVEALESSDLQKIVSDRGATSIRNPIDLIAVVHDVDRSITLARSQDRLTTGRLSAFIPDILNIKRNIT